MPEDEASADLSNGAYVVLGLLGESKQIERASLHWALQTLVWYAGVCVLLVVFRNIASFFRRSSAAPTVSQSKPRKVKKLPEKRRC